MPKFTLEIVECPECTAPAEIVDRFVLESTAGPIEHATVLCVLRHRFTVLVERPARRPSATPGTVDGEVTFVARNRPSRPT